MDGDLFPEEERLGEEWVPGRTRSPTFPVPHGLALGTADGISQGSEFLSIKSAVGLIASAAPSSWFPGSACAGLSYASGAEWGF